jgi:hypothetical protein
LIRQDVRGASVEQEIDRLPIHFRREPGEIRLALARPRRAEPEFDLVRGVVAGKVAWRPQKESSAWVVERPDPPGEPLLAE